MPRFLLRLWALLVLCLPAAATPPFKPARDLPELQGRIAGILEEYKVPGMGLALVDREGTVWAAGVGKADVASGRAATADTLFRIGSISKIFAALSALKLVEEGRLSLDAPVRSLVPEVKFTNKWEATDPVRVVHLLEHTTGWDNIRFKEFAHDDPRPATLAEGLAVAPEARTSRWRPGTCFSYCNSGPAVTAAIVEKLTGRPYEEYVKETLFKPIGMPTADFFEAEGTRGLLTTVYHQDGRTPYPYLHLSLRPAGAVNASSREMGALLRFFLRRGVGETGRVLSEASILRMETPTTDWGAQGGLTYGYGLHNKAMVDDRGFVWHGHSGAVSGCISMLAYLPEQGVGFFGSLNAPNGGAGQKIGDEIQAYLTRELPSPALPPAQAVPAAIAQAYGGWYAILNPQPEAFGFLERVLLLGHATFQKTGARFKLPIGPSVNLMAVDATHYRTDHASVAQVVLMDTPGGRLAVSSPVVLERLSAANAWTRLILLALFALALVSVPLYALVWGSRWLFRRMKGVPGLRVRLLPLLAWAAMAVTILDLMLSPEDFNQAFGRRTLWSMALTGSTWAFAILSLASLWTALGAPRQGMNRWAYWHSLGVALVFSIVAAYLAWSGFIGWRSWA